MRPTKPSRVLALSVLTALISLAAIPALAHPPAALRVVANFLDLSEEQAQNLVAVRTNAHNLIEPLVQEIAVHKSALQELLQGEDPNPAEVGALVINIRELERQVVANQSDAAEEIRSSLDEEQLRRLMAVDQAQPLCRVAPAFQALHLL